MPVVPSCTKLYQVVPNRHQIPRPPTPWPRPIVPTAAATPSTLRRSCPCRGPPGSAAALRRALSQVSTRAHGLPGASAAGARTHCALFCRCSRPLVGGAPSWRITQRRAPLPPLDNSPHPPASGGTPCRWDAETIRVKRGQGLRPVPSPRKRGARRAPGGRASGRRCSAVSLRLRLRALLARPGARHDARAPVNGVPGHGRIAHSQP